MHPSGDEAEERDVLGEFEGSGGEVHASFASDSGSGEKNCFELSEASEGTRGVNRRLPFGTKSGFELRTEGEPQGNRRSIA